MMLLGIYKDINDIYNVQKENLYFSWDLWQKDIFSPATEILFVLLFKISGKTYQERKENLKQLAIDFQTNTQGDLSYGELTEIENFFEKNAKRYGLYKEFKENCII